MPKAEKNEWRLVTDFTPLNIHIKKLETVAPTIQEAKEKLAKFKFHIQLDLSNYFYQGGMQIEDSQYLATPHPFKGLRVYTCEPQGLKNASEHAYEKLARIYGDLCGEEKMTRMADGLFILGETLEDLEANFIEVLSRARLCGLTFKPSKVVIAPVNTLIFGWKKIGDGWKPTSHTTSPLTKADPPITVKQLRSWLGSYKQLTNCISHYATLLGPLEDIIGNRASAERITWTAELVKDFDKAKDSLKDIGTIFVPKPTDVLHTYSDYSAASKAVGGRLEIHRPDKDGSVQKLLGGHFSCRVSKHQKNWYPCEGEALATKLVVKHFSPYLRENISKTTHHTDNMPTVQAWKRSKTGAFSTSARISSFLSGLSALNIELIYTPGKDMKSSDYNSRHPTDCKGKRCQICNFAFEMEMLGDNVIPMVGKVTVEDIEQGKINMPYTQRAAWLKVQMQDKTHQQLSWLIETSQTPEKKKTKGENTKLKLLHNLYKNGSLKKTSDGLITVTHVDMDRGNTQAISVPSDMYPGLIQALHLKLNHPSKAQMQRVSSRYFYSPGHTRIMEEISNNCSVCASLKQLPAELFSEITVENETFASNFSADVIKREGQKILLCREKLSQFTITCIITDETADSLREALVSSTVEMIPATGTTIQVDEAPAFQTLKFESESNGSVLKKLGISVDLGRTFNKNKNPVAENAIKEFHKECLRLNPSGGQITEIDRARITKTMNSRIRTRGYSAKEIAFQRDQNSNQVKPISDEKMAAEQYEKRKSQHPKMIVPSKKEFNIGQNVFLNNDKSKLRGREMYKVVKIFDHNNEKWATLQKAETQFRAKQYKVKFSEIFHVPGPVSNTIPIKEEEDKPDFGELPDDKKKSMKNNEEIELDKNPPIEKKGRKTAILARKKIQEMASSSLLAIKAKKVVTPSLHTWNWKAFNQLVEAEDDFITRRTTKSAVELDEISEDEHNLSWDNSPEQYEILPHDDDTNIVLEHRKLFTSDENDDSPLTNSTSDDDVFPSLDNSSIKSRNFRRTKVIKKPKHSVLKHFDIEHGDETDINEHNVSLDAEDDETNEIEEENEDQFGNFLLIPRSPSQVVLNRCQHLGHALQKRTPVVPEAVQLCPEVQDFSRVLDVIQPNYNIQGQSEPLRDDQYVPPRDDQGEPLHDDQRRHPHDELLLPGPVQRTARPRRSTRLDIDYESFHTFGEKIPQKRPKR